MKKVLTILVVLALVCGAVFAAETHSVRLRTVVGEVIPVFQMTNTSLTAFKDVDGVKTAVVNVEQTTNGAEAKFVDDGDHTYTTETRDDIAVGDLSKYDVTVVFTISVANQAKTLQDYKLSFTAGAFAVKRDGITENQTLAADANATPFASLGVKNGVNGEQSIETSVADGGILVDFNGNECTEDTILGTYTVSYTHDPSIDPDVTGYTADITMLIETTT